MKIRLLLLVSCLLFTGCVTQTTNEAQMAGFDLNDALIVEVAKANDEWMADSKAQTSGAFEVLLDEGLRNAAGNPGDLAGVKAGFLLRYVKLKKFEDNRDKRHSMTHLNLRALMGINKKERALAEIQMKWSDELRGYVGSLRERVLKAQGAKDD